MLIQRIIYSGCLFVLLLGLGGCFESHFLADRVRKNSQKYLDDRPPPPTVPDQQAVSIDVADTTAIDGMVGKINGRPIYCRQLFDSMDEQLRVKGRTTSRPRFRAELSDIMQQNLRGLVTRERLLAEANRDLNENELRYLDNMMHDRREEEIRKWGEGSPVIAEKRLREQEGKGLDEHLKSIRSQLVVQRYLLRKFRPEINVTRKTVERYYERNRDQYNPPAGRVVRVIRARSDSDAKRIGGMLDSGTQFVEVASDRANFFYKKQGLIAEKFTDDAPFAQEPLNAALAKLSQGQRSPEIDLDGDAWWLYLEKIDDSVGQSLDDVQLQIESQLVDTQFEILVNRYRNTLIDESTEKAIHDMTALLVEVAMNRYAQPQ